MNSFRTGAVPRVIAHRGGSQLRPENTILAFEHAYSLGVRTMELDVHLTADGAVVVHHDDTLDRTTNGTGPLDQHNLLDLLALDAGYRFVDLRGHVPDRGRGLRIPTLDEVLDALPDVAFILEMKPEGPAIGRALRACIDRSRVHDRVCVAGFHEPTLAAFRALPGKRVRSSAGQSAITRFWAQSRVGLDRFARVPFDMLQVPPVHNLLTVIDRRFVAAAHRHGVEVHAWTIDVPSEMERLFALGVDAVITDRPDLAVALPLR